MTTNDSDMHQQSSEQPFQRIQETMVKTYIALPLLDKLNAADAADKERLFDVIIDANLDYPGARSAAREWILTTLAYLLGEADQQAAARLKPHKNKDQPHYVFARLKAQEIRDLVSLDGRTNAELEQWEEKELQLGIPRATRGLRIPRNQEPANAADDPQYWVPRAMYQI